MYRNFKETKEFNSLVYFIFLALILLKERKEQYQIMKEIQIFLNQKAENIDKNLTKKQKLILFLHIITLTEFILLQKVKKYPEKFSYFMKKIKLSNLCSENMFFFILGISFTLEQSIKTRKIPLISIISISFSFLTSTIILFNLQKQKILTSHQYKPINSKQFSQFPLDF